MFGQQGLSSGLEYLPGLVAFNMNVAIGAFGMIEVLIRLSRHMQQVFLFPVRLSNVPYAKQYYSRESSNVYSLYYRARFFWSGLESGS